MKTINKDRLLIRTFIVIILFFPLSVLASGHKTSIMNNDNTDIYNTILYNNYIIAADNTTLNEITGKPAESRESFQLNIHKYLGWTTIGMMGVTIATGFVIPDSGHCTLAGISTGLAVATCVDGIYEYGGLISITDGDWRYNTHAILGTLAAAGFITTLALADDEPHVATGIASGTAFTLALAVIYF